jgi:hypothetical protein
MADNGATVRGKCWMGWSDRCEGDGIAISQLFGLLRM